MNYARFYYQDYFSDISGKFIHIDDDCIVQGQLFLARFRLSKKNNNDTNEQMKLIEIQLSQELFQIY